jgi:hypothetical protein
MDAWPYIAEIIPTPTLWFISKLVKQIPEITEVEHKIREIIVSLFKSSLVFDFWIFPLNHQLIKTNWLILNKKTKQSTNQNKNVAGIIAAEAEESPRCVGVYQ